MDLIIRTVTRGETQIFVARGNVGIYDKILNILPFVLIKYRQFLDSWGFVSIYGVGIALQINVLRVLL